MNESHPLRARRLPVASASAVSASTAWPAQRWVWVALLAVFFAGCDAPTDPQTAPSQQTSAAQLPERPAAAAADSAAAARPDLSRGGAPGIGDGRPASFADLVAAVRPAVVNIYTRQEIVTPGRYNPLLGTQMLPQRRVAESLGSGFIIDTEGHVLTNHHVVQNATQIGVRLLDERFFRAELVGADPKTDVALLRIVDAEDLPVIQLGDAASLRVGDWVLAIGNPLGLNSTVTAGIASAIGRHNIPIGGAMRYQDFIQTDASINPGNSGGPLINTAGEVVGINTAISAEGQGIGFATPINMAVEILGQLKEKGRVERSWLGVYVEEVPVLARRALDFPDGVAGALVTQVVAGGPAQAAGLARGDILLSIDGDPVDNASKLAWIASNLGIGKTVAIDYWRADSIHKTQLTLGALPD